MGVLKNGVGRPSNETIKKRNILKIVCVILVLIIIGLICYILNDKGIIKINNDNKKVTEQNKVKEEKEVVLSDEDAKKIVKSVFGNYDQFYEIKYLKTMLSKSELKTSFAIENVKEEVDNSEKHDEYTCKELFGNDIEKVKAEDSDSWKVDGYICDDGLQDLYSYSDVNKQYKKMFGDSEAAEKHIIKVRGGAYVYSKEKNSYTFLTDKSSTDILPMVQGFKNAVIKGNILTIDYANANLEDWDGNLILNDGTVVECDDMSNDEAFSKYKDKIDTEYTLVFEKQKDEHYIFKEAK